MRHVVAALLVAASLVVSAPARADAVPPPPARCPPGRLPVTSHAGPACELAPPTNCAPGWKGIIGGHCILTPCTKESDCDSSEECAPHSLCLAPHPDDYYDWNEVPAGASRAPGEGPLLGAPAPPRQRRPKPIMRYDASNVCAAGVTCAAPSSCETEKLCVRRGRHAEPQRAGNALPVRVARTSEIPGAPGDDAGGPVSASDAGGGDAAEPPVVVTADAGVTGSADPATPEVPAAPPDHRGCAACASGGDASFPALAGLGLAALVSAIAARRRK